MAWGSENTNFGMIKVYLGKSTIERLKVIASEKGLPVSRLIAYAVDNEISQRGAKFDVGSDWPVTPYEPNAYADEAGKLFKFLLKFKGGLGADHLVILRDMIGIATAEGVMNGLRELEKNFMIYRGKPSASSSFKTYKPGYLHFRIARDVMKKRDEIKRDAAEAARLSDAARKDD